MSAMSAHTSPESGTRGARAWWESTQIWAGVSIVAMWAAVIFCGIFAPNLTNSTNNASVNGSTTSIPSVIPVAICALLATVAVAHAAFPRREAELARRADAR